MTTLKNIIIHAILGNQPIFANVATGVHEGNITKTLESAAATRYLLGTPGSAPGEVDICGDSDAPLGVITDEGAVGDPVNVAMLGGASSTLLMVANGPIAVGSAVYTAADGKVQEQPEISGNYFQVGFAVTAASSDGDRLEVMPVTPRFTIVLDAFSGTAATDIDALGVALGEAPDKVIVLP